MVLVSPGVQRPRLELCYFCVVLATIKKRAPCAIALQTPVSNLLVIVFEYVAIKHALTANTGGQEILRSSIQCNLRTI